MMKAQGTIWLIVPAAGRGTRMGATQPKQYLPLAGRPVLAHTLERLCQAYPEACLCLCLDARDSWFDTAWVPYDDWRRVDGGDERSDSVMQALEAIADDADDDDLVIVHDAARPCVSHSDLLHLKTVLTQDPIGALLAAPVADTMKRADDHSRIRYTESRERLWHALTPQGFRYRLLYEALQYVLRSGVPITDEASAVEALGYSPQLVVGRRDNLKITHPDDLVMAELVLAAQASSSRQPGSALT
ncbi:2-C-methyl-D-erythritol 4-phosphate cytidylyltransferase [Aidingimonas halophila]|uniref:2-C-methyl-D-erythritol 4-phosphate cytidylyltransferase n=1 Tax=Aidingimonas halophila TaxID=574349 RepID=A0A1H2S2V3_9GAMM|nr:2-C-methyl-D-erythritol 4-phosphate cytidylyltransferase [Aidingimonas halophila]GHC18324.1 2-C-methyl-D-erythritol 4-phosphate cytidylyltransferase [Aidingimonas halophila]SDW25928.1 2-C-methyl-D-erythritol 4-phosphate cytidylyltransferase [Aidingimonas halophila]